jgi:hypothetical protein
LPKRNAKDAREIPEEVLQQLEVIYAENIIKRYQGHRRHEVTPVKRERARQRERVRDT